MKKNILLSSLLCAALFLGTNIAQAGPHGPHGPHGGVHQPQHPQMHRPPMHAHIHRPPRHSHHVRHYYGIGYPRHYGYYYPIGINVPRLYYPLHSGHFGATFHISI